MKTEQLGLFAPSGNPLEKRLGKSFFDALPKEPGVYKMFGRSERLLYVGKAKNLRNRLFTYRRVKAGKGSRKTRRLVRMIRRIDYDICTSEEAALLRENAIIRNRKPEFNRAKKSPGTYYYVSLRPQANLFTFRLAMRLPQEPLLEYTYGAFKGHRTVRKGCGSLLRLLYLVYRNVQSPFEYPNALMKNLTPLTYQFSCEGAGHPQNDMHQLLHEFLSGESLKLLARFVEILTTREIMTTYLGRHALKDLESLRRLFDYSLHRNYQMKQTLQLSGRIIPQEQLDDCLIKHAFATK